MSPSDRRKHIRYKQYFKARLSKKGLAKPVEGTTENISQGGALIKTSNWRYFKADDNVVIRFILPTEFRGHQKTVGLHGTAVVIRTDEQQGTVALRFNMPFRQFERIEKIDVRYK